MSDFLLNESQRNEWYENIVRPVFMDNKQPSENPRFVLLTGQPAAGKTTLSFQYAQQTKPEPVKFGGDDIRILHPLAGKLLHENPEEYPFLTKKDMSWARERLIDEALESRFNIQLDSILSNPEDWRMGTLLKAKQAGYNVECIALGVHRYLSEVSMFIRQEEQIKSLGVGFPVTMGPHDRAYDILPEVVGRMFDEKVADKVCIYNRLSDKYYDTSEEANPSSEGIMMAILKSRNDYLRSDSLKYIETAWQSVYDSMLSRNASPEQLSEVRSRQMAFRKNSGLYLVYQNKYGSKDSGLSK